MDDKEIHAIQAQAALDLSVEKPGLSKYFCELAVDHCYRGLKLDGDKDKDIKLYLIRAIANARLGFYPCALEDCDNAIGLYDNSAELYLMRASVHEKKDALDKARADRDKALELAKEQGQTELAELIQKTWPN